MLCEHEMGLTIRINIIFADLSKINIHFMCALSKKFHEVP